MAIRAPDGANKDLHIIILKDFNLFLDHFTILQNVSLHIIVFESL